jgi:hypothetical protein
MPYRSKRVICIKPEMDDFETVGDERNISAYIGHLVQLYKPSPDPKKRIFKIGILNKTVPSKREIPGTDKKDFAVYLRDALERPELPYDSYLYLEKKDTFGTTIYMPRILADGTMFMLMDTDSERLERFRVYLSKLDEKLENKEITEFQHEKSIAEWQKKH